MAVNNLRLCIPVFPLYAVINTTQGIFRGASDMMSATSGLLSIQVTKILVTFFLVYSIGVIAIWVAIPASIVASSVYS